MNHIIDYQKSGVNEYIYSGSKFNCSKVQDRQIDRQVYKSTIIRFPRAYRRHYRVVSIWSHLEEDVLVRAETPECSNHSKMATIKPPFMVDRIWCYCFTLGRVRHFCEDSKSFFLVSISPRILIIAINSNVNR